MAKSVHNIYLTFQGHNANYKYPYSMTSGTRKLTVKLTQHCKKKRLRFRSGIMALEMQSHVFI